MKEEAFQYGENKRGFGVITLPNQTQSAPIVVYLNAGLLHREEPYRLNVLAARMLAELGYIGLRVDLSGKGDTPAREGLVNRESVATDWKFIKEALELRFGKRPIIIMGLCSGADNGIKIAAFDSSVTGLILLDPISPKDEGFKTRTLINKLTNPYKWLALPFILMRKLNNKLSNTEDNEETSLRDEPTMEDMVACFRHLVAIQGRVIAFYTNHALTHYNQQGQFTRVMGIPGLDAICQEFYWPHIKHLYPVQTHREQLLAQIQQWGKENLAHFKSMTLSPRVETA